MPDIPLTRATFIADNHVEIAIANLETMVVIKDAAGEVEEIPIPQSVKESGVLPDGYCIDFVLDPITVIKSLAKGGIRYEGDQFSQEAIDSVKEIINAPGNLAIVPISVRDAKLQVFTEEDDEESPGSTELSDGDK